MKTAKTLVMAFYVIFSLIAPLSHAQERTPAVVERLMETRVPPQAQFVPGEVIVKMRYAKEMRAMDLGRMGLEEKQRITSGGEIIYRFAPRVRGAMSTDKLRDRTLEVVRELANRPDVEYAQPNYILRIADTTPNDPRYPEQWHYFVNGTGAGRSPGGIGLPVAWDTTKGSSSVVVAVIDTGILPNHPDIQGSPNLVAG